MKKWFITLALSFFVLGLNAVHAEDFTEGVDYALVTKQSKPANPGKITVTEVFWYGCPHCFRLEPFVVEWKKTIPADVVFEQVPSVLNPRWSDHARAYFALEMMGAVDKVHQPLLDAIHVKRQRLTSEQTLTEFVTGLGVDGKQFKENYYSFPVDSKLRKARQKERKYGHTGVPAVIVNGKYRTSGSMAGSYKRMMQIVDFLVEKERQAMKK